MQVVKYNDIEYNIPFDVDLTLDSKDKLIEVANPFSGQTAKLPWFAVAVYDLIIRCATFRRIRNSARRL
jgi:hypothetical protein